MATLGRPRAQISYSYDPYPRPYERTFIMCQYNRRSKFFFRPVYLQRAVAIFIIQFLISLTTNSILF